MTLTGYTVSELAKLTGKNHHTVETWLSYHQIKPLNSELLYPPEILDMLQNAKRGRPPKKPKDPENPTP
jgi:hypothetical protein